MSHGLPSVTIVIAARPDEAEIQSAIAGRQLDYPSDRLEVIVARGRQPSVQRNAAIKAARGEIVYFLDDDSVPLPGNLRRAAGHFVDPAVTMVGGPNLCPATAPWLEQLFALTMGSWLALGPSRARYRSIGAVRETTEKELILCNLLVRRDALLELGGFNEALYPNEENALMDAMQKRGNKLLYDPELIVHRRPRRTLKAFFKMLLTYGRGRAEQFRIHPTPGSLLNFVPPLFCLYLVVAPFLPRLFLLPLAFYAMAVLAQAMALVPLKRQHWVFGLAPLIMASHIFYGLGLWRGLFTTLKAPSQAITSEVKLEIGGRDDGAPRP